MIPEDERRTILVVDDTPDAIAVLEGILKKDYRVKAATSGEAALGVAHDAPMPDLILLDVAMPAMDGFETCRRLKLDGATAKIPVIFVTSKTDFADEATGFALGAVDYITKPVNPHLVRARVNVQLALKQAREELERQNDELQETARLREQVEAINRHDLKNPLTVIMTVPAILLARPSMTENEQKLLGMVRDAGRRMLEMINRTVDLFKMEKGTYVVTPVPVNLLGVVEQIENSFTGPAAEKNLAHRVTVRGEAPQPGDTFSVKGEDLLVYSLLANLYKNAVEASPPGGVISISIDGGEYAEIAIHNAGAIPRSIRGRFFEKFATAGKDRGTGLGAYSARLIANTLGGAISFDTSEESGTTIRVRLPPA
jgi:CheY-like chemotaxis protein